MEIFLIIALCIIFILLFVILLISTRIESLKNLIRISEKELLIIKALRRINYDIQFTNYWMKELKEKEEKKNAL